MTSRREFLAATGTTLAAAVVSPLARLTTAQPPIADGRFVRTLPLGDPLRRDDPPLNQLLGTGLDARLFTDLSRLAVSDIITPSEQFFVRTACPEKATKTDGWTIACEGRIQRPLSLHVDELSRSA